MKIIKETIRRLFINSRNLYIFICGVFLISILPIPFLGIGMGYSEPVFSITSDNEPLSEVLAKVSKSTGYKIEITKGWENKSVTVSLKKIPLEKGLREIMRMAGEPNDAIVINERVKKIEIRIFDGSSPGQIKSGGAYVGNKADFRKRDSVAVEQEMVDVSREPLIHPEPPPDIDIPHPEND